MTGRASLCVTRAAPLRLNRLSMNFLIMGSDPVSCSSQGDHFPPPLLRVSQQRRIGIDGHRMVHALEERHVVQRVAVEPAFEVREALALPGEPLGHARDLSLAKAG